MAIFDPLLLLSTVLCFLFLYYIIPYTSLYVDLRDIPGPIFARFSNLWLLWQARRGKRYLVIDAAHKKYGKLVRIQPNQVSIADETAIPAVYGHGNGFLKSDFYDSFVSIRRSLFNTRDRSQHARKRKILSHTFSAKSVGQFEKYMRANVELFIHQWDQLASRADDDYAKLECLSWFNFLAFDIIGDLAFGQPFGMLEKGMDITQIRMTPDAPISYVPAVEVLNRRGDVSATLGCLSKLHPYAKYFPDPFFSLGATAVENLAGIAVARVAQRLDGKPDPDRVDILSRLMQGKDESGAGLGRDELTAEALTQIVAGSDTTSNTMCAILFWILKTPDVLSKLRAELDDAISDDIIVPSFDSVKSLPYLNDVINETLRIHSTSSIGLPREVPPGPGVTLFGQHFPAGTVLSVPAYTIHHSQNIWGADADEFVPQRWQNLSERQKGAFIPFSHGPRGCIGRNVAMMELTIIIAAIVRRWDFKLHTQHLESREGFLRKPIECFVGIKKRTQFDNKDNLVRG
ncbi:Benzoate 4-monooxygenase [Podosphaera aphanis]|nr:Benzoate 4-monooxygenase [Podosphaera aphanis]